MSVEVQISRCQTRQLPGVMDFIECHWSRGHILAHDDSLMRWQHGDPDDPDHANWLLAAKGADILGVIGYIPLHIFSLSAPAGRRVVWVALWKVRPEGGTGLGLRLLKAVERFEAFDAIGVLGLNPAHPPMYRALGFQTGELRHFVAVNPEVGRPAILKLPEGWVPVHFRPGGATLTPFKGPEDSGKGQAPHWLNAGIKTALYFDRRYLRHPTYKYHVFTVQRAGSYSGLLAVRVAEAKGRRALRVIDFMGDPQAFAELGSALSALMTQFDAEYVDVWEGGFSPEILDRLGMVEVKTVEGLVAPNFFEPFEAKNGRMEFAMKGFSNLNYLVMRGDGDQDRPNLKIQVEDLAR